MYDTWPYPFLIHVEPLASVVTTLMPFSLNILSEKVNILKKEINSQAGDTTQRAFLYHINSIQISLLDIFNLS